MRTQRPSFSDVPTFSTLFSPLVLALALSAGCGTVTLSTDAGPGGSCGNGTVDTGEECDTRGESAECDSDCTLPVCGDDVINTSAGEECDGPTTPETECVNCTLQCAGNRATCADDTFMCQTDTDTDPMNCGFCGNPCPGSAQCVLGQCVGGEPPKRVFLSSNVIYGDFGAGGAGALGADNRCQAMAAQAGLQGQFMAWVSDDNTSPAQRFNLSQSPYVLMDGTVIATNWQDLTDGTLSAPIELTEFGQPPSPWTGPMCHGGITCRQVFTGTDPMGRAVSDTNANCSNWSQRNNLPGFAGGDSTIAGANWTLQAIGFRCDYLARLYCFEQ